MLTWRLTGPTPLAGGHRCIVDAQVGNFANVRASVDAWLRAAAVGLVKAGIYRLQGFGNRRAYSCPECKEVIKSRWVSALPPAKWSPIAEACVATAEAREVLYDSRAPSQLLRRKNRNRRCCPRK